MAKIVTLKNSSDEEVYPITTAEAVNGGLYADSEGTPSAITADVTTSRIADGAVTSDKVADGAVTTAKMDFSKFFFYKACPQVNPFNISAAWTRVTPSGWSLTFDAEEGAMYKVEISTGYLCWNGPTQAEFDFHMGYSGALIYSSASSTMTGTYGGGVSVGRTCGGIIRATSTSVTVRGEVSCGSTGNYARIDNGHIFVMRIG